MNKSTILLKLINELLDDHYHVSHTGSENFGNMTRHYYHFRTDKKNSYNLHIDHDRKGEKATVAFEDDSGDMNLNHKEKNSAHKVLSTVTKTLKDHLEKHPKLTHVGFEGDSDHAPVYRRIAKRLSTSHTETPIGKGRTSFSVDKSNIK